MPDFCTCGAELPPDARFCHKCGKPQRESEPVWQAPSPPPLPHLAARPAAPSFHHPVALRVGLFVASVATLLFMALPFGFVIWLPSAGFLSVYLFKRRTGQSLSIRSGAHMGWIAGILSFVLITVLFTISIVAIANQPGGLTEAFRQALRSRAIPEQQLQDLLQVLSNPMGQAFVYLFGLLLLFTITSIFCLPCGALA